MKKCTNINLKKIDKVYYNFKIKFCFIFCLIIYKDQMLIKNSEAQKRRKKKKLVL